MKRFLEICGKLLRPHWLVAVLLCLASAAGLGWVFFAGNSERWFAYPIYVTAFYTLCVVCVKLIPTGVGMAKRSREKRLTREEWEKERHFRVSLYRSLAINLAFGIFYLVSGILSGSVWTVSNGGYYMVLTLIRCVLAVYERKLERIGETEKREKLGWKGFRLCGVLMLLLNLAMTVMAVQMICREQEKTYYGIQVIAMAAYTFYKLTVAVIRVAQYKKNSSPVLGAARNVALTAALMSVFSLQSAMFGAFGGEFESQTLMNILTGSAVCLSTVAGAVGMVLHGSRKLRELRDEKYG